MSSGHSDELRSREWEARGGPGLQHPSPSGGGHTLLMAGVGAVLAGTCRPTDKGSQEVSPSQIAPLPHLVNRASPRKPRGNVSLLVRPYASHSLCCVCQLRGGAVTADVAACHPCLSLGTGQASSTCLDKGPPPKGEAAGRAAGDPVPPDQMIRLEEAVPESAEVPGGPQQAVEE